MRTVILMLLAVAGIFEAPARAGVVFTGNTYLQWSHYSESTLQTTQGTSFDELLNAANVDGGLIFQPSGGADFMSVCIDGFCNEGSALKSPLTLRMTDFELTCANASNCSGYFTLGIYNVQGFTGGSFQGILDGLLDTGSLNGTVGWVVQSHDQNQTFVDTFIEFGVGQGPFTKATDILTIDPVPETAIDLIMRINVSLTAASTAKFADSFTGSISDVPEPASVGYAGLGAMGIAAGAWAQRRRAR